MFKLNRFHQKRAYLLVGILLIIGCIVGLVLFALRQNINLYFTPLEIYQQKAPLHQKIRVGGMVKENSVMRSEGLKLQFTITDFAKDLVIGYEGILPDLFREGQGVVVLGYLKPDMSFQAVQVLAKHDENYMPPEVRDSLQSKS